MRRAAGVLIGLGGGLVIFGAASGDIAYSIAGGVLGVVAFAFALGYRDRR